MWDGAQLEHGAEDSSDACEGGVTVSVRVCQPGDEHELSLVGQATFLDAFAGVLRGEDIRLHCARQHAPEIYRAYLEDPRTCIWIAEADPGQAPVGYLVAAPANLPLPDLTDDDTEVKRLYLLHRVQRAGLGRRLIDCAATFAARGGSRRLLLGVYDRNHAAIGFYEHLGFSRIGTRTFRVGAHDYDDLILERRLA
jgi:ribosomal protein S18 acetylase RimI-like enzyme